MKINYLLKRQRQSLFSAWSHQCHHQYEQINTQLKLYIYNTRTIANRANYNHTSMNGLRGYSQTQNISAAAFLFMVCVGYTYIQYTRTFAKSEDHHIKKLFLSKFSMVSQPNRLKVSLKIKTQRNSEKTQRICRACGEKLYRERLLFQSQN